MLSQAMDIALVLLVIAAIATLILLTQLFYNLARFIKEARSEIIPSLHLLQSTIEEVNGELAKIEQIMESVQGVTDKVNATTRVAQEVISSPLIKLASVSFGAQKALRRFIKKK